MMRRVTQLPSDSDTDVGAALPETARGAPVLASGGSEAAAAGTTAPAQVGGKTILCVL